jgi:kynureninase
MVSRQVSIRSWLRRDGKTAIKTKIHSVRFELTRDSIPLELESNALDRSATNAVNFRGSDFRHGFWQNLVKPLASLCSVRILRELIVTRTPMTDDFLGYRVANCGAARLFEDGTDAAVALDKLAAAWATALSSPDFAKMADEEDPLRQLRSRFLFPKRNGEDVIYFVGNSLGLQPKECATYIRDELDSWSSKGVNGHFEGSKPWLNYDDFLVGAMSRIVGALPSEVALMNSLTVNLHLLLIRFYNPTKSVSSRRRKILIESRSFPSDFYALESQIRLRGLDPAECIVEVFPRPDEHILRSEDVIEQINKIGDELALVMFSGVQFYTGQLFDIPAITNAAHSVGAYAVWDLAHAAGSVDLKLHDWKVDGACWCTYKYLNSGPGGIGGFFIHQDHFNNPEADRLLGWWGHKVSSRFEMTNTFEPSAGADEFRLSNVPILSSAALLASLEIFDTTTMSMLRAKSLLLTGYLEHLLEGLREEIRDQECQFKIITGTDRGPQLSLLFESDEKAKEISTRLEELGVMIDYRKPGLIRPAPSPLYCTFTDVLRFKDLLAEAIRGDK